MFYSFRCCCKLLLKSFFFRYSLQVYRNTSDFICWFYILQLWWISLLALTIFFSRIFLHIRSCHMQRANFTTFFPIWVLSFSFSFLIVLAEISSTMLNKTYASWHLYFSWSQQKSFQYFTIEYVVTCGFFLRRLYNFWGCFLLFLIFWVFLIMKI